MSDAEVVEPKKGRGRPPNPDKNSVAPKKRARALSPKESKVVEERDKEKSVVSDDGEEPSPKRGRGRPKGSTKKASKAAKKAPAAPVGRGRGRGRKKPVKEESSEEEEDDDDEEDDEQEDSEGNEENYDNEESDS
uniref:Uncharacterized protein n=1 Tax=Anopheles farauti TaxID=69004 RepID=A0A182QKP6_9DIPT